MADLEQGYSQIAEDIGVLVFLLAARPEVPISQNVKLWETLRKPRAERIKASAAFNQSFYTGQRPRSNRSASSVSKSLKNTVPDMNAHFATSAFLKWTLDHDVIEEVSHFIPCVIVSNSHRHDKLLHGRLQNCDV